MKCKNCGNKIERNGKFCPKCGTSAENENPSDMPGEAGNIGNGKKPWQLIAVSIVTLVIAAAVAAGAFLFIQGNKSPAEQETSETVKQETAETSAEEKQETTKEEEKEEKSEEEKPKEEKKEVTLAEKITQMNGNPSEAVPSIDIDADNYKPAERDMNAAWDKTLFYTLEDVSQENDKDGKINGYQITKKELINADSRNVIEYNIYTNPQTGAVHKIVSIEYTGDTLEITEYYYTDEGKINFIYAYHDINYFPSYATPDRDGERFYFDRDIMTKWRVVSGGTETNYVLGANSEEASGNAGQVIRMEQFAEDIKSAYDAGERRMINAAYNTYHTVLGTEGAAVIQGYVYDENDAVKESVDVILYALEGNQELYRTKTDAQGLYTIYVPAENFEYYLVFQQEGCAEITMYGITWDSQTLEEYQAAVYMINGTAEYEMEVLVDDALNYNDTGNGMRIVADADYVIRKGINNRTGEIAAEGKTDSSGCLRVRLPAGMYTVQIERNGYDTTYFTLIVRQNSRQTRLHLSPKLQEGEMRIVLTWKDIPQDLDSHLFTPYSTVDKHICYYNKKDEKGNSLDVDVISGYGPETVTLSNLDSNGLYKYYVADYTNCSQGNYTSREMSNSNASVQVYTKDGLAATFHVPTGQEGVIWEVFEIRNGAIIPNQRYYRGVADNDWWERKSSGYSSETEQNSGDSSEYLLPTSNCEYISREEISRLSSEGLRMARNEIYARHGFQFTDSELQRYFERKSWYQPSVTEVADSELNAYELANRDLILEIENGRTTYMILGFLITQFEMADNNLAVSIDAEDEEYDNVAEWGHIGETNFIGYPVAEDCVFSQIGVDTPETYRPVQNSSYQEIKKYVEEERELYLRSGFWESPAGIYFEIENGMITKMYRISS